MWWADSATNVWLVTMRSRIAKTAPVILEVQTTTFVTNKPPNVSARKMWLDLSVRHVAKALLTCKNQIKTAVLSVSALVKPPDVQVQN